MARMHRPTVAHGMLTGFADDHQLPLVVGAPEWYAWLAGASTFLFVSDEGTFTAYKERFRRGGWYWRAYRRRAGKLYRAYLGKSEHLTGERLQAVAARLAGQSASTTAAPSLESLLSQSMEPGLMGAASPASKRQPPARDAQWDPLLVTKLHIPVLRAGLVPRARLTTQIDPQAECCLTLISAPVGFGKTTLLSEWSARSQRKVAWVSLDAADNDPVRFWRYLLTAQEMICPGGGEPALALLRAAPATPIEALLTLLINTLALLADQFTLILDDYQVIHAPPIHQGIAFLLDHAPPCLHVIIASREDPPLPLARLRVRDQLTELRTPDLRFTQEEARAFFLQRGDLLLSAEEIASLETRIEGWIAGLQLAALSLHEQKDRGGFLRLFTSGSSRSVADYLLTEVLHQQPPSVQSFLLQTAMLDRLSGSLCDAVTERGDGQALLLQLEQANLFLVPLDEERQWYRYHHLFAEFLRARQQQEQPEDTALLHIRAARWYERQGLLAEAIQHALAAEEFALAGRLIEQAAEVVVQRGELITLRHWLDALPDAVMRTRPRLCLVHARALVTSGQMEAAEGRLQQAEQGLADPTGQGATPNEVFGEIAAIRAEMLAVQGNLPRAIALSEQALELLPAQQSFLRASVAATLGTIYVAQGNMAAGISAYTLAREISLAAGNMSAVMGSLSSQGYLHLLQGHVSVAAATFQQAVNIATSQQPTPPLACLAYVGMGKVCYEWNELEAAAAHLRRGLELGQQRGDMVVLIRSLTALARIAQIRGEGAAAGELIQRVEQFVETARSPTHMALAAASCARLWLTQGDFAPAVRWAQAAGLLATDELNYHREFGHLTLARVLLAQERLEETALLLERLRSTAASAGRGERVIESLVLQALTFQAQGATPLALRALAEALTIGEAGGYLRIFLDEGASMAALLAKLLRAHRQQPAAFPQPFSHAYISKLLAAFPAPVATSEDARQASILQHNADLLSEREQEVLRLVAAGKSNREIAAALVIEPSTVIWHIKRIFSKLDAHSRTQALLRAQKLRILR